LPLSHIELRGVRVHNLKDVDLDIPHRQLVAFCGMSGSGKTSLALDTLYAEGQRRYIESFSAYTRQFLEQLEKPDADRIDGIPPAIAVTHKDQSRSSRSTIGAATEIDDYLRLLFARIGRVFCRQCQREVRRDSPATAAQRSTELPTGTRLMVVFAFSADSAAELAERLRQFREDGFVRAILEGQTINLTAELSTGMTDRAVWPATGYVVVDRLVRGEATLERLTDSLETASNKGDGRFSVLAEPSAGTSRTDQPRVAVDESNWSLLSFTNSLRCEPCGLDYPTLDPRLYNFNSPLGACPRCEGIGTIVDFDMELIVPDPRKSLRDGAIAAWSTKNYGYGLEELLSRAAELAIPVDLPFHKLTEDQVRILRDGLPEQGYGGLRGFFQELESGKSQLHQRAFLARWRSPRTCPECGGTRLRPESLATRISGRNIADLEQLKIDESSTFIRSLELTPWERQVGRMMLDQIVSRLRFLEQVGLGYLTLNRSLRTLSGGEAQRVALTSALGSSLVNMLYVLDEPSVGLHPCDVERLVTAVKSLRDRGNSVIVVEHEEAMLRAADHIIEIGPSAGERGGEVTFQGTLDQMMASPASRTGDFLSGRRVIGVPEKRRTPTHGWVKLMGARGNNLKNINVEFPLGLLCLVTGVSGAGKSTLVQDTLYGAICRRKRKEADKPLPYNDVYGDGQIDDVILIDQSPIGRTPRSNPVTYVKAFDEIRHVFAETIEARTHNYTAGHFSFNVDGGRCPTCSGDGYIEIDMQFLADVFMKCSECHGTRYRKEILDVLYRGLNIADVLDLTIREAFSFFRGQLKVQEKLKKLMDVGLDYLRLGQPANTLSAGEAQRLKLAAYISSATRNRTLFIMDEPTTGLHYSDIVQLLDCFDALLSIGHSLIVVEHNLQMMKAADYIIDLGPGAGEQGGQIVIQGSPEQVAQCPTSITGRFLAEALATQIREQSA
jgi:excinuclease ABC subunit A